ncbi:uncharacterized protein LOC129600922 [Paramacrobiotus metropolitanus]|uniref:uncharacterized protein LOC129600922 n=1 Tax=Paramacrobiotus metropolitanus TaxID=2943436 RepID=UPI00244634F6|nr:uncharacterized protein LOC129600922 [Paramacrobiotus metropolitanus]
MRLRVDRQRCAPCSAQAHVSTVVHWVNGVACTDVVPLERLRWTVNSEWWATIGRNASVRHDGVSTTHGLSARLDPVEAGTFHKRSLLLSGAEDWRHVDVDKLSSRLNERVCRREDYPCRYVSFVGIADGHLSYVWRYVDFLRWPTTGPFQNISLYPDPVQNFIRKCDGALVAGIRAIILQLTEEITSITEPEDSSDIGLLTVDVLLEVFSQLDTRTQTGLRTVCFTWNAVLESPVLTAGIVIIGFGSHHYRPYRPQLHYFLTSPVFKCFRQSTQHIVVAARDNWMQTRDFLTLAETMHYVSQTTGHRVLTVYLVGLQLKLQFNRHLDSYDKCPMHEPSFGSTSYSYPGPCRLADFIAACTDLPCQAIRLVICTVLLDYASSEQVYLPNHLLVYLPSVRLPLGGDVDRLIWGVLGTRVPTPNAEQLDTLATWLASLNAGTSRSQRRLACRAVCATQTADPRPSSHYRGKEWCVAGLRELRLENLSSIALHFLVELAEYFDGMRASSDDSDSGSDVPDEPMDDEFVFCSLKSVSC